MPRYHGQIVVNYSTEELPDLLNLDYQMNLMIDGWQKLDSQAISWDDVDWTINEEETE
jgi:hypothetical protein